MRQTNAYASHRQSHETVIYGICVHRGSGRHYCFNRDYLVLPVTLPKVAVRAIAETAIAEREGNRSGHGRFRPDKLGDEREWTTYFVFNDGSAPKWSRPSYRYDRGPYEALPAKK